MAPESIRNSTFSRTSGLAGFPTSISRTVRPIIIPPRLARVPSLRRWQRRHYLIRDPPHQFFRVAVGRPVSIRARRSARLALLDITPSERAVAAQIAVLAFLETAVVVTEPLIQIEQFLRLLVCEVVHVAELLREDQDLAIRVDDL